MPRPYRMNRRADSAGETRERIVRATYALHAEKGIAATTVRDIAERADVAVGSVYHHFPTYDDVIEACGAYTVELTRPPDASVLDGVAVPAERITRLVEALFAFYQRSPGFERARADRDKFDKVEGFFAHEEATRRALIAAAVKPLKIGKRRLALAFALLDAAVYSALLAEGLVHAAAVETVATLLRQWLLQEAAEGAATRRPGPARGATTA